MTSKTVFFGIMIGNLFEGFGDDFVIDYDASVSKYAEMCEDAIVAGFKKHGEIVDVDWDSQDVGGCVPYGLSTKVNGMDDDEDIEFVDELISDVWQEGNWVVETNNQSAA